MHELMKPPKRPNVRTADETAILRAQNYECVICGDWLTRDSAHLDHAIARFLGGSDAVQNIQAVCVQCHIGKSYQETLSNVEEDNPLMSRFKRETHNAFHLSAKPHGWSQHCTNRRHEATFRTWTFAGVVSTGWYIT